MAQSPRIELARLEQLYDRAMGAATGSNKQCISLEQRLASALKGLIACQDQVDDLKDDKCALEAESENLRTLTLTQRLTIQSCKESKAALWETIKDMHERNDKVAADKHACHCTIHDLRNDLAAAREENAKLADDKYFDKVEIRNLRVSLDKANESLRCKGVTLEMTAANLAAHTLRCGGDPLARHPDDVATEVIIMEELPGAKRKPVEHEQLGDQPLKRRSARLLGAGAELGLGGSVAL